MLRQIHEFLVQSNATRKYERRFARWVKDQLGVPDANGDSRRVIRPQKPAAVWNVGAFRGDFGVVS